MNKFERGFMTVGASLLGAVLVALPILAQNMLATPSSAPSVDPSAGTTGLTAIQLESQNTALRDEIKSLSAEITKYKLASIFIRPTLKSGNKGDDVK
jgi:hypothetical protein